MGNNDLIEYFLQMGVLEPGHDELKRKQAMVDALRQNAMTPQKGQMVSGHYVAPGLGGLMSQMGNAYMAEKGQRQVDVGMQGLTAEQKRILDLMRKKKRDDEPGGYGPSDPYQQFRLGGSA